MKLVRISAKNLKGLSFDLGLKDLNFFVGTNFVGKTARSDAIRLLLVGWLPELGKLPSAIFGLCSGRELIVEGEFDNGLKIKRRWYVKGDSVKSEHSVPDEIASFGPLVVMLNSEEWFGLSERDRIAYISENIPATGSALDPKGIVERLKSRLTAIDGVSEKTVLALLADLKEADVDAESQPGFEPFTAATYIDHVIETVGNIVKGSKAEAARMEQTVQGLTQLRLRDESSINPAQFRAEKEILVGEIQVFQGEKAKHAAAYDQQKANEKRRSELTRETATLPALKRKLDSFKATVAGIRAEINALPSFDHKDYEEQSNAEREADRTITISETNLRAMKSSIESNERELAEIESKTACPYCGATGDGWKTLKSHEISSAISGLATAKAQLEASIAKLKEVREVHAGKLRSFKNVEAIRNGRQQEILKLEKSLQFETGLGSIQLEAAIANLDAKVEELGRLPGVDPALVAAVETAQTAINIKNDAIAQVDRAILESATRAGELRRLAQAETGRDEQKLKEQAAKEGGKILREIQAEMVAQTFAPLLDIANDFFGDVLKSPLGYHDGEIGSWREGIWVGHRTFSGSEKALAYAAIQIALASKSPVRLMILDELGRLSDANVAKVLIKVMASVQNGKLDGFVGIDVARAEVYKALEISLEPSCQVVLLS